MLASALRTPMPVETRDVLASQLYRQSWRRRDGGAFRQFHVLALDEQLAEELGGIRLREKYDQSILDWRLETNRRIDRIRSVVFEVLATEDPEESKRREEAYEERDGE